MLWRLWSIWDVTGRDPFCVYHSLRDDYVPVYDPEGGPIVPPYPDRLFWVMCAFGRFSQERKEQLAGAKKKPVPRGKGRGRSR